MRGVTGLQREKNASRAHAAVHEAVPAQPQLLEATARLEGIAEVAASPGTDAIPAEIEAPQAALTFEGCREQPHAVVAHTVVRQVDAL